MKDLGEKAQMEIGVHGIHPEILKLVGRIKLAYILYAKPISTCY